MKVSYRGFEIDVTRSKCLGGWSMLYYSVFRKNDRREMVTHCEDSAETVRDMVGYMKHRVDMWLALPEPREDDDF